MTGLNIITAPSLGCVVRAVHRCLPLSRLITSLRLLIRLHSDLCPGSRFINQSVSSHGKILGEGKEMSASVYNSLFSSDKSTGKKLLLLTNKRVMRSS